MDAKRGALLAWMSIIYFRRDAKNYRDPKPYLPDLPVLGRLLSTSWKYAWTDASFREVYLLGKASGYPFSKFLADLELLHISYGSCSANLILLDTSPESWSLDSFDSDFDVNRSVSCASPVVSTSLGHGADGVVDGPVALALMEGAFGSGGVREE